MDRKLGDLSDRTLLAAQLRKGVAEFCVLALLRARSMYGRELAEHLTEPPRLVASEGSVYPILTRLRRMGWVESSWVDSTSGPRRRYYEITAQGKRALREFTHEWGTFRGAVDSALANGEKSEH